MIKGTVIKGDQRGRLLGFPTANIIVASELESGVYAGKVTVNQSTHRAAIFRDKERNLFEAYILDFVGDLYGQEIEIEIIKKIREISKFENVEDLKRQIALDVSSVANF